MDLAASSSRRRSYWAIEDGEEISSGLRAPSQPTLPSLTHPLLISTTLRLNLTPEHSHLRSRRLELPAHLLQLLLRPLMILNLSLKLPLQPLHLLLMPLLHLPHIPARLHMLLKLRNPFLMLTTTVLPMTKLIIDRPSLLLSLVPLLL